MKKNLFKALLLSLIVMVPRVYGLEINDGKIRIRLHEDSGRFSVYFLDDIEKQRFVPLLFTDDPRTSHLSILIGNKVYTMGETSEYRQTVEEVKDGAQFVWTSSSLVITEKFSFLRSAGTMISDGFKITITARNISEQDMTIGFRYLFDTYLGEKDGTHFTTESGRPITSETLMKGSFPAYWLSPSSQTAVKGLQCMLKGEGVTVPEKVIFANWKRLNESPWAYEVNTTRNFNYLPYSINDSAVVMYYEPMILPRGGEREISILAGGFSQSGFSSSATAVSDSSMGAIFNQAISQDKPQANDRPTALKTELFAVNDFIAQIDKKLKFGETVTEEELAIMRQVLNQLSARKSLYEKQ